MTTSNNSVFLKELLSTTEKKKFANFFDLPEKVFDKALGVLDTINFNESSSSEKTHRLLLFHYSIHNADKFHTFGDEFTPEVIHKIHSIRGIIIAERNDELKIVGRSYGYTKVHVMDQIPEIDVGSGITENELVYKLWVHGALIRCFKYEGIVYASTHRKISCAKSRFGHSDQTFEQMLLNDQNTFNSLDSIFTGGMDDPSYVHLFILNNRNLIIEANVFLREDRVYYVGTINLEMNDSLDITTPSIEQYIKEKNTEASNPIMFPSILTREQANIALMGDSDSTIQMPFGTIRDVNDFMRTLPPDVAINLFKKQGSVIAHLNSMKGTDVFRVMPTSKKNATLIMKGVPNPAKIFTELLAKYGDGTLFDEVPIVPTGFSINQLTDYATKIKENDNVDIAMYELDHTSIPELILTSVVFSSPNSLIMDAIDAFNNFGKNVVEAAYFLHVNRGTKGSTIGIENVIKQNNPKLFDGFLNLNKAAKDYMHSRYLGCFFEKSNKDGFTISKIIGDGVRPHWHPYVSEHFNNNKNVKTFNAKQINALLAFISNAPPDAIYSLLQFKQKVEKTREAFARTK